MNGFINWLDSNLTPKVSKFSNNVYVKALQRTMIMTLSIILISSIINILQALRPYLTFIPDMSMLYNFTFYLLGMFVSIILPYYVMEGKKHRKIQLMASIVSLGVFLMVAIINVNLWGATEVAFTRFGPQGMVVAILVGYYVSFVMIKFVNFSFFSKDTTMPEFVTAWFNQMVPIFVSFFIPWLILVVAKVDIFVTIESLFAPLTKIANTPLGFAAFSFFTVFFYTMGVSGWVLSGVIYPVYMSNIAANAELVAAGNSPIFIATNEVYYSGWCTLGGLGATLMLVFLMLRSRSTRLRGIAKASLIPSICNINEPLVYGTPIVLNPILMIPMWINAIIVPILTFVVLDAGFVTIPSEPFNMGFIPYGISTYLVNFDFRGLILLALIAVVTLAVWYPFFKTFEKGELLKEANEVNI